MRKVRGYCDFCTHSAEEGDKWESQCQMAAFALTTPKGSAICKSCVVNIVNKLRGSQGFEEWMTTANQQKPYMDILAIVVSTDEITIITSFYSGALQTLLFHLTVASSLSPPFNE